MGVSANCGNIFWGPYNLDPIVEGILLGCPIFGFHSHIIQILITRRTPVLSSADACSRQCRLGASAHETALRAWHGNDACLSCSGEVAQAETILIGSSICKHAVLRLSSKHLCSPAARPVLPSLLLDLACAGLARLLPHRRAAFAPRVNLLLWSICGTR